MLVLAAVATAVVASLIHVALKLESRQRSRPRGQHPPGPESDAGDHSAQHVQAPGADPVRPPRRPHGLLATGLAGCDHGRHDSIPAAGRSPGRAGRDRAPGAVAVHRDRPPREPGAAQPGGLKVGGHQASSRVDGVDHDVAVVRAPAGRGPGVGQAARLAGAARDQLPARRAGRVVPDDAARVRRAAELSQPGQGPRPGRLLDRVGRHRRDRADLGRGGPPLPAQPASTVRERRAGSTRWSATPSSTRARSGRPSSIPAWPSWARSSGSWT